MGSYADELRKGCDSIAEKAKKSGKFIKSKTRIPKESSTTTKSSTNISRSKKKF